MNRNRIIGIVVLLLLAAGVIWAIYRNKNKEDNNVSPNLSVSVTNTTQNADGTTVTAHPKDNLVYTLTAENPSDKVITGYVMEVGIGDLTRGATLIDAQGANYNSANNSLIWTPLDIPANESIQKQFTVRVKDTIPANPSERVLRVSYSNEVAVNLGNGSTATNGGSRPGSTGSGANYTAPTTGIPGWTSFYLALFITLGLLFFRMAHKLGRPGANKQ